MANYYKEIRPSIVFRTEAGFKMGLGHIKRSLKLAEFIERCFHPAITFLVSPPHGPWENLFQGKAYCVRPMEEGEEGIFVKEFFRKGLHRAWVSDLRMVKNKSLIQGLAERHGFLHIAVDDMHLCGLKAEITINPSIVPCSPSHHFHSQGKFFCGVEYFFQLPLNHPPASYKGGKRVLISMGGSDPNGVTIKLLPFLLEAGEGLEAHVVVGPAFRWKEEKVPVEGKNIFYHHSPECLGPLITKADLVITSAGLTLYETVRLGIPAIAIPQNPFEERTAQAFQDKGVAVTMGTGVQVDPAHAVSTALSLLKDPGRLKKMFGAAKGIFKGSGFELIKGLLEGRFGGAVDKREQSL